MAKPVVVLLLGSLALLHLCSEASAGVRHSIEPIVSNVYYLEDYCALPEKEDLEEKYRHRRSSSSDEEIETDRDHDHDHDHDHGELIGYDIQQDIRKVVKYYTKKGYRKVKNQIEREMEFRAKWKTVYLDPMEPSAVVRLWRPEAVESDRRNNKIVEDAPKNEMIQCKLLLRLSGELSNSSSSFSAGLTASFGSVANSTLGAVVNFLKLNKNPLLNDYRLRIVTSDPNMTQYWLAGRKLATTKSGSATSLPAAVASKPPVAVDLVTHPQMNQEPLMKLDLDFLQMMNNASKWLLIELETMNQAMNLSGLKRSNGVQNAGNNKDDTELVISLYTKSANVDDQQQQGDLSSRSYPGNNATSQCPIGTFDCAGDGLQCIPSALRCNGEENCGNRFDELFNCGTVNLYYIFGSEGHHGQFDFESDGFWFAVRILILLFLICLVLYMTSLLCQCCCGRRGSGIMINGRSPMVYVRSAKGGPSVEPLLAGGSAAAFGATAGRAMKLPPGAGAGASAGMPSSPPPSYFGNQNDNQKSNVNEYIYVNNNYGQPQGSTTVYTSVRPSRDNFTGGASAPPYMDNFPPLYPNLEYPNYGGTNQNQKC